MLTSRWGRSNAPKPLLLTFVALIFMPLSAAAQSSQSVTVVLPGDIPLEMVLIPSGTFEMGSNADANWSDCHPCEQPIHTVTFERSFYMGKYEVTEAQWEAIMGSDLPGVPDAPVRQVSWYDCQQFVETLNNHIASTDQGLPTFRLPSEAEWEYACRAGTTTSYNYGDSNCQPTGYGPCDLSDYAWWGGNNTGSGFPGGAKPVGQKPPNPWGLHDMHGNVLEWCLDDWHDDYEGAPVDGGAWINTEVTVSKVMRGGGWLNYAQGCRSARRSEQQADIKTSGLGLRLVRTNYMPVPLLECVLTTDNSYTLYVNGNEVGGDGEWQDAETYVAPIDEGTNVIAIACSDTGGQSRNGLLGQFTAPSFFRLSGAQNWRVSATTTPGWTDLEYDDSAWSVPQVQGNHGDDPWGVVPGIHPDAQWVWSAGQEDTVYFRTTFTLPEAVMVYLPGNVPLEMVPIPQGSFEMGSDDPGWSFADELPVHTVTFAQPFLMGRCEVTQRQWEALMDDNPSYFVNRPDAPVDRATWTECQAFVTALNEHMVATGQGPAVFRFPSEAEWEYACRAGTTTRFPFGDSTCQPSGGDACELNDYAWWLGNNSGSGQDASTGTKTVGQKMPNAWGLYDMLGNAQERCQDYYHDDYIGAPTDGSARNVPGGYTERAVRGGGWHDPARGLRPARHFKWDPDARSSVMGFRLASDAFTPPPTATATPRPTNTPTPTNTPDTSLAYRNFGLTEPGTTGYLNAGMRVVSTLVVHEAPGVLTSADIDVENGYAYFGTYTDPGHVIKVDLGQDAEPHSYVGHLRFANDEYKLRCGSIDAARGYGYFCPLTQPSRVVKFALNGEAAPTRVGRMDLVGGGEAWPRTTLIDPNSGFIFVGGGNTGVTRVTPGDGASLPQRESYIGFLGGEGDLACGVIDASRGYAYFGAKGSNPSKIVKIALGDEDSPARRVGATTLEPGESGLWNGATIDTEAGYAYFGTESSPRTVVKVALGEGDSPPRRVGAVRLENDESAPQGPAVFDPVDRYLYYGTQTYPARVVKIAPGEGDETPTRIGAVTLPRNTGNLQSAVIDPQRGFAYFGSAQVPAQIAKLDIRSNQKGRIHANRVTVSDDGELDSVRFYSHAAEGHIRLALYRSVQGEITLLWESPNIDLVNESWLTVDVENGIPGALHVERGYYWLAWQVDTRSSAPSYLGELAVGWNLDHAYGPFPSEVANEEQSAEAWSAYLTLVVQPSPTPVGTPLPASVVCPEGWYHNPETNHCYTLTEPMNWLEAQAQAEQWNGNLVTINDELEQIWLHERFGDQERTHIGFTDMFQEGDWVWISGEAASFTNWCPDRPNNVNDAQHWGYMNFSPACSGWDDIEQTVRYSALFESGTSSAPRLVVAPYALPADTAAIRPSVDRPVFAFRLSAVEANMRVASLSVTDDGTADGAQQVQRAWLYQDTNGNGAVDSGEPNLAVSGEYPFTDNVMVFTDLDLTIATDSPRDFVLAYDINDYPGPDQTLQCRVAGIEGGPLDYISLTPPFEDGAEIPGMGWTRTGDWARSTEAARTGDRAWSDSPGGDYYADMDASLTSPLIDLSLYEPDDLQLSFWHMYETEAALDVCRLEVSEDGGASWTEVASYDGVQADWQQETVSLADHRSSQFLFRFRLQTDGDTHRDGWHVDDIALTAGTLVLYGQTHGPEIVLAAKQPAASARALSIPGQPTSVARDARDVPLLAFSLTSAQYPLTVHELGFAETGSINEWEIVENARLYRDTNASRTLDAGDVLLGDLGGFEKADNLLPASMYYDWAPLRALPAGRHEIVAVSTGDAIYAFGGQEAVESVESNVYAYDPMTNTWSEMTSMPTARAAAGAAYLDGEIFVAGGWNGVNTYYNAVEAYDVTTDTWRACAPLPFGRKDLSCVALDGEIYAIGGFDGSSHVATVQAYTPTTDSWRDVAPLNGPRDFMGVAVLNGKIYAAGGWEPGVEFTNKVEVYDPVADTWTIGPSLPQARHGGGMVAYEGKLYTAGGQDANQGFDTIDVFDPETGRWTSLQGAYSARWGCGVAEVDGVLYLAGGVETMLGFPSRFVEGYDIDNGAWLIAPRINNLPLRYTASTAALHDGYVYLINGLEQGAGATNKCMRAPLSDIRDTDTLTIGNSPAWEMLPASPKKAYYTAVTALGDKLYCAGGEVDGGVTDRVYSFDVPSKTWLDLAPLPRASADQGLLPKGDLIYAMGGVAELGGQLTNVDWVFRYDIVADQWHELAPMPAARRGVVVFEHHGDLYVSGGREPGHIAPSSRFTYDPDADHWTEEELAPLDLPYTQRSTLLGGVIPIMGYHTTWREAQLSILDPWYGSRSTVHGVLLPRLSPCLQESDGRVFFMGGRVGRLSGYTETDLVTVFEDYGGQSVTEPLLPGQPVHYVVVADLNGSPGEARSLRLRLASGEYSVDAYPDVEGRIPPSEDGAPITIQERLATLTIAQRALLDGTTYPRGSGQAEIMAPRLVASNYDGQLLALEVRITGDVMAATDITSVSLWSDIDQNAVLSAADALLGSTEVTPLEDGAVATLELPTPLVLNAGVVTDLLVTADFTTVPGPSRFYAAALAEVQVPVDGHETFAFGVTGTMEGPAIKLSEDIVTPTDTPIMTATDTPTSSPTATSTDTPTPTPTDTPTPTSTWTMTPTSTPSATATNTPAVTPIPTSTWTMTATSTPSVTATSTATQTETPAFTPTSTNTNAPTDTPLATQTSTETLTDAPSPTDTHTSTETPTPTGTDTATPTASAIETGTPTPPPSETPTTLPSDTPTTAPSPTMTPWWDVDGDGQVTSGDLLELLSGRTAPPETIPHWLHYFARQWQRHIDQGEDE